MDLILENLKSHNPVANRIEALRALAKLLLHEVESLAEISPTVGCGGGAAESAGSGGGRAGETEINLTERIQRYEADLICSALLTANGNQRKAARILGMKTTTLHAKIKRYEIDSLSVSGKF